MAGLLALVVPVICMAGPFTPERVGRTDPRVASWATAVASYTPGPSADPMWRDTTQALGQAEGTSFDVVSLGRGGTITLTFGGPITDIEGADFAVFENSFSDNFIELAFVEVSDGGTTYQRFPVQSLTPAPIQSFGVMDPTNLDGFAGTVRQGFGVGFDIADLNLTKITHVRLVDVVGDGRSQDAEGRLIYDPFPTNGSAGFDLDGIAVLKPTTLDRFDPIPGGFLVTTETSPGVSTILEFCTDLNEGVWLPFTAPQLGTGSPITLLAHGSFPQAFYRIRRESTP